MTDLGSGADRLTDAYQSMRKEVRHLRKRVEKQTRTSLRELQVNPLLERVRELRSGAVHWLAIGVGTVLGRLQIVSRSEIERVDRKLTQIDRRLRQVRKTRKIDSAHGAIRPS